MVGSRRLERDSRDSRDSLSELEEVSFEFSEETVEDSVCVLDWLDASEDSVVLEVSLREGSFAG